MCYLLKVLVSCVHRLISSFNTIVAAHGTIPGEESTRLLLQLLQWRQIHFFPMLKALATFLAGSGRE